MPVRTEPNQPKSSRSLVTTLVIAFVLLSVIPMLVVSGLLGYFDFQSQQEALYNKQQFVAAQAATEVSGFIQQSFSALKVSAQVGQVSDQVQQQVILEKLLGVDKAIWELLLVGQSGQKIAGASRRSSLVSSNLLPRAAEVMAQVSQNQQFISEVYIDEVTSEPLVILAVPVKNVFGDLQGALLAELNLKFMWDVVEQLKVGETGTAFVVNRQGDLIAFGDAVRVLKGENLAQLTEVEEFIEGNLVDEQELYSIGIKGSLVVANYVPLGTPDWAIITEIPIEEAYQSTIIRAASLVGIVLFLAALAAGASVLVSRILTMPLLNLTQTATRLAGGEIQLKAALDGPVEVIRLASAFNEMTTQLQELINSLEQRVAARTRRLEIVASLSERLTSILNPTELLGEVVNQVKDSFGYYHTHIYLLDNKNENLVVAEGTGKAGVEMKAKGHRIALNAPTSLVARAARSGEIVKVDNVREAVDWLPNPLLPDTYSEMAVPIILDGRIVGVLDVQENKIAGLDEGDISLLRSLANQVAVSMRNARLFETVETALGEAREAQMRYQQQAWDKTKTTIQQGQYHYTRPGAPILPETTLAGAKQQALEQNQPALINVNGSRDNQTPTAIVAPVNLRDDAIGYLQLYSTGPDQVWTERDLAIVAAVTEQLAQTAENLRLFDETRRRAGQEQIIRQVADRLRSAPNIEQLITIATEEVVGRLSATHARLKLGIEPQQAKTNGSNR